MRKGQGSSLIRQMASSLLEGVMHKYFHHFPRNRSSVVSEDWENLLILDACRYDIFKKVSTIPGNLQSRLSQASYTGGFFEKNFGDRPQYDTVYVTANPVPRVDEWCDVDIDAVFHDVVDVWEDNWDEGVNTVWPEAVATSIKTAAENYPNKRIIGHFIQPHQPFIGKTGQKIDESGMRAYSKLSDGEPDPNKKVWEQIESGELSSDRAWKAYRENLELVLPHVTDLQADLVGKTVVTSDHGNLFGEFAWPFPIRMYGHPPGIHTGKLIKVPWFELDFERRRKITSEPPVGEETEADKENRIERLRHLGYN